MKKYFTIFLFIFFCIAQGKTQEGMWVWMGGDSTNNNPPGIFGTKGTSSPANKPPGLYECAEWTDNQGNFWLFGGVRGFYYEYNTLWKYNTGIGEWTWISGSNFPGALPVYGTQGMPSSLNTPGARGWGALSWTDNNGNFWLFGGWGVDANGTQGCLNDLWKFDPVTLEWTWMSGSQLMNDPGSWGTIGISSITNQPNARNENNCSWTDNDNNLWFYGGLNVGWSAYNDLWKFDTGINEWTWMWGTATPNLPPDFGTKGVESSSNDPGGRFSYTKFNDGNGNFYLFGAGTAYTNELYADVWKYNLSVGKWTWVGGKNVQNFAGSYIDSCAKDTFNIPNAKYEIRASWPDDCGFWFFGGAGTSSNPDSYPFYNDLWYYNLNENTFTWVNGKGNSNPYSYGNYGIKNTPSALNSVSSRIGSSSWEDNSGNLWLFGGLFWDTIGMNDWKFKNDLWKYVPDTNCVRLCNSSPPSNNPNSNTEFLIPNIFTPNNDGQNDFFEIKVNGYKNYLLKIYNRWGQLIFSSDNRSNYWNGKVEQTNKDAPDGTYYYILELTDNIDKHSIYRGFLTLLRNK